MTFIDVFTHHRIMKQLVLHAHAELRRGTVTEDDAVQIIRVLYHSEAGQMHLNMLANSPLSYEQYTVNWIEVVAECAPRELKLAMFNTVQLVLDPYRPERLRCFGES